MKQRNNDLFLILIIVIVNQLWQYIPHHNVVIGMVMALPLVFFIPGYLLIGTLNQKRERDGTTLLLLSIGLSLSIDILGGFLLNFTSAGLTALTWDGFLGIFTITCTILCLMKRRRWQRHGYPRWPIRIRRDRPIRYQVALLSLAVSIVMLAFLYTTNSIASQRNARFTQFWLLLENQQSHSCAIQIGIASGEVATTTYRVEVKENNQYAAQWSPTVAPQQKWQGRLPLPISIYRMQSTQSTQSTQLYVEADLYREQEPDYIYRNVQLLVPSSKTGCFKR